MRGPASRNALALGTGPQIALASRHPHDSLRSRRIGFGVSSASRAIVVLTGKIRLRGSGLSASGATLAGALGEAASDSDPPLAFGESVCPECLSSRIVVVANFGSAPLEEGLQRDPTVSETQLGRCEDCGESLRREFTAAKAAMWQTTGF